MEKVLTLADNLARLDELTAHPQWVCWRQVPNPDKPKPDKLPYNPNTDMLAKANDPATWTTFDVAMAAYKQGRYDGIGYVFSGDDGITGIDLDDAIEDDIVASWAVDIVHALDSYTERSVSGHGLHILTRGILPPGGRRKGKIELYDRGRFFALTGDVFNGTPIAIYDRQEAINALHARIFGEPQDKPQGGVPAQRLNLDDIEILQLARNASNGAKFEALWRGDTTGYPSQSEADLALCDLLAFWTGGNEDQIDRLFRQSGLYRAKWDQRHGPATYGAITIAKAMDGRAKFYNPQPRIARAQLSEPPPSPTMYELEAMTEEEPEQTTAERFNLTDLGNAKRFISLVGEDIRYCHAWARWLVWDGSRWAIDTDGAINRLADIVPRSILAEAAESSSKAQRKKLTDWARASESRYRRNAFVAMAQDLEGVPIAPDELDADPYLLNVRNGTINLRTGKLREPQREDFITKQAPVDFGESAKCPLWLKFQDRITNGNTELIAFKQRVFGYGLTADTSEQVFFIHYGTGANGKSTELNTIRDALGPDYAQHTPTETLMAKKYVGGVPNDLARLKGARFVTAIESEAGRLLAEALVKQMTGNDPIPARFMRAEWFEFIPTHKIHLAVNHKPEIRGTDYAMWRRIRLIPYTVTIPANERDPHLSDKLKGEAAGILAWAVRGCLAWQREGLHVPEAVQKATDDYQGEMDILLDFIADRCTLDARAETTSAALYEAYTEWCTLSGEKALSKKMLGLRLQERGLRSVRIGSRQARGWGGIGLRSMLNDVENPDASRHIDASDTFSDINESFSDSSCAILENASETSDTSMADGVTDGECHYLDVANQEEEYPF